MPPLGKIRNKNIKESAGETPIVGKMMENRFRWFGNVNFMVRRIDQMERTQTIRGRGRLRKIIREVIKNDLKIYDLDRSIILDIIL